MDSRNIQGVALMQVILYSYIGVGDFSNCLLGKSLKVCSHLNMFFFAL